MTDATAHFTFVGDPRMDGKDMTESCDLFGMHFPKGKAVEVKDGEVADKLRRHSHFKEGRGAGRPSKAD